MSARKFVLKVAVCLVAMGFQPALPMRSMRAIPSMRPIQPNRLDAQQPNSQKPAHRPGAADRNEIRVGAVAPDWRLKTIDGQTITLSGLRGDVVVLDFWANWCGPCHKMMPVFDQLARQYQGKPIRFFTLSIRPNTDFNPQTYLKDREMASTFLIGDEAVDNDYSIWGLPTYFIIDPQGKVSYIHVLLSVDPDALEKRLREAIETALSS